LKDNYEIRPIGVVRKEEESTWLELYEEYEPALLNLELFSHIITLWWITGRDTEEDRNNLQTTPRIKLGDRKQGPLCGVFCTRSPARPNPIGLTTVKILKIEGRKIFIDRTDAFDNTPIIDIKPYLPRSDYILNVTLPDFFESLREKRKE